MFKIIKFFFPVSFLLMSCANNQSSDILKSAVYNLDDYEIIINSPKGLCVNSDLTSEKNKILVLILTECIRNQNSNQLIRRPISSLITVKFEQKPGLNKYPKIYDFIKSTGNSLNQIFNKSGQKVNKTYQKGNTIYISLSERSSSNDLETGNKFWRTLSVYDNVLVSISAYGFSKKNSNHLSYLELKDKLNSVVNSIKIKKIKKNTSV
tara:strand:+ start:638 stop:1261 length:624 start_codon:yes stop_codon:yes gene_type:complete